jgi:hypothetical protein
MDLQLNALAWLHSVGYTWLIDWGFSVRSSWYACLLAQLDLQTGVDPEERRNNIAA